MIKIVILVLSVIWLSTSAYGAEILFQLDTPISLEGKPAPDRFEENQKGLSFDGILGDSLQHEGSLVKPIGSISFWAKLDPSKRAWDEFDITLLYADIQEQRSYLRFRYDGYNSNANSLITISSGRFVDWRGNWFFNSNGTPRWFHVVFIPHVRRPVLYVDGVKVDSYDSKYSNRPEENLIWSNWSGENIHLAPHGLENIHKFNGVLSDFLISSEVPSEELIADWYDGGDSDGDGLGDWFEQQRGMNRLSSDTDSDGLTDYEEMGYGNSYELLRERLSWSEAVVAAQYSGGHLATISSQLENDLIIDYLKSQSRGGRTVYHTWIGGTDARQEGVWEWVTQEPWEYANWGLNEPSNGEGHLNYEHYLHIVSSSDASSIGVWNDHNLTGAEAWTPTHYLIEYGYTSDPLTTDRDGDGLSDLQESKHGANPYVTSSKLVVRSSAQGSVKINRTSGYYEKDSLVIAEAVPNPGYAFNRWVGVVDSSDNPVEWKFGKGDAVEALYVPSHFILDQPRDKSVPLGDDGSLVVALQNVTDPSDSLFKYQWFKDDQILDGETDSVLQIENMSPEKEGSYRVEVSNESVTESSATAYVSVIMPLKIESIPQILYLESGTRDFRYDVEFNNVSKLRNIVWYRNGRAVSRIGTKTYEDDLITVRDNGVYSVYATDGITEVRGDVFTIEVMDGPQLKDISIKADGPFFSFYAVEGFTYEVYQSDDLENWNLAWSTEGGGQNVEFLDDNGFGYSQRFYKVVKK